jgi:integrase
MPQPAKPARLYLRPARDDREPVWVILHRGIEHSTGARKKDLGKAQEALKEFLASNTEPSFGLGHPHQVLISDVLTHYGDHHGPHTADPERIGYAIDKLVDYWKQDTVAQITPARSEDYVKWRTAQRDARAKKTKGRLISVYTARRELGVLATALQWCFENNKLNRPIAVKLPESSEPREEHLTRSEAAQLLAAALGWYVEKGKIKRDHSRINRHVARFILLGIYTGTRHTAMLRLQWSKNTIGGWIDLGSGVIYRRPQGSTDTKKKRPPLPLPPKLIPHLRRWRNLSARHVIEWNGEPLAGHIRRAWTTTRKLAKLPESITPHILRHTCATWLLQRGVSIYDTAGVLGCSEEVVRKTYGHPRA